MNYTKGKWEQSGSIILVYGEEGGIICQMAEYRPKSGLVESHPIEISDPHWGIQIANGNLIVVSPRMIELIAKVVRQDFVLFPEDREETKKILTKAEGKEER